WRGRPRGLGGGGGGGPAVQGLGGRGSRRADARTSRAGVGEPGGDRRGRTAGRRSNRAVGHLELGKPARAAALAEYQGAELGGALGEFDESEKGDDERSDHPIEECLESLRDRRNSNARVGKRELVGCAG